MTGALTGASRRMVLLALLLLAGALNAVVLLPAGSLRAVIALPSTLVLPGAALGVWLLPAPRNVGARFLLQSLALSLVVYPVLAVVLQWAGYPLTSHSVLAALDLFLVAAILPWCILHLLQQSAPICRSHATVASAASSGGSGETRTVWRRVTISCTGKIARCGLAAGTVGWLFLLLCAFGLSISLTRSLLPGAPPESYMRFALAGGWATTDGVVQTSSSQVAVTVEVTNHSVRSRVVRLVSRFDGLDPWPEVRVRLRPQSRWQGRVQGSQPRDGMLHRLTICLVASGHPSLPPLVLWFQAPVSSAHRSSGPVTRSLIPTQIDSPPRLPYREWPLFQSSSPRADTQRHSSPANSRVRP
jgi:hypothetical protein